MGALTRAVGPRAASPIEFLARVGFVVKGALYATVGLLAMRAGLGRGGAVTGSNGALSHILRQPFGSALLLIAAIGLFGYAVWRVAQGVLDTERRGGDLKALAMRASYVARGALHAAVGWKALQLYRGLRAARPNGTDRLVAEAFAWPLGEWGVIAAGVGLFAFAGYQIYRGAARRLGRHLDDERMAREIGGWTIAFSRIGLAARGAVFAVIAWYLVEAGVQRNPNQAADTADALRFFAAWPDPVGSWLLGAMGAGLIGYGVYQALQAKYRRIPT